MIKIIAAVCRNRAIGRAGDLIYHLRDDLRRFKTLTMGHPIVMGRKTFESFPNGPLPGRRNIVISRQKDYHPDGAEVYPTVQKALEACAADEDVFVIGGGEIYRQFIPLASELLLTEIDDEPADADTFFPAFTADAVETTPWQGESPRFRFATYKFS